MGAFLDKPKTDKTKRNGEAHGLKFASAAMQGWRMEMEDSDVFNTKLDGFPGWSFFGVFDGHAGSKASRYCSENLCSFILKQFEERRSKFGSQIPPDEVKKAIADGFLHTDKMLKTELLTNSDDHSGTTSIVVLVSPTHIFWANCGDSRGIFCKSGKLEFNTQDHKPNNADEKNRIEKAGGTVMMQRVNGTLAVSRALGDFDYKRDTNLEPREQLVSPEPDITVIPRDEQQDEFLLLACDGIYDVMSNDDVLGYVRHQLYLTDDLADICCHLIDSCLQKNSRDNMSVVLVVFPASPKVSEEAIKKEEENLCEAKKTVVEKLTIMVNTAHDTLEVEENSVIQHLLNEHPEFFNFKEMRQFISDQLQVLTRKKFTESSVTEMQIATQDGGHFDIRGVMTERGDDEYQVDECLLMSNEDNSEGDKQLGVETGGGEEDMEFSHEEEVSSDNPTSTNAAAT